MGMYINPKGVSKEVWLRDNGEMIEGVPAQHKMNGKTAVCWVHNGGFTAAAICFNAGELAAFSNPSDPRPKKWFWVEDKKLKEFMQ